MKMMESRRRGGDRDEKEDNGIEQTDRREDK